MDIVAELERLVDKRQRLANEIAAIDNQMTRVRLALGFAAPKAPEAPKPNYYARAFAQDTSKTTEDVCELLAKREPLTAAEMAQAVGLSYGAVQSVCVALA